MLWMLIVCSSFLSTYSISTGKINSYHVVGVSNNSLVNVTRDQCVCQMLRSNALIVASNYFEMNQTCDVFDTNESSLVVEFNANSSLLFINRTSVTIRKSVPSTTASPCMAMQLGWNSTGITVLGSSAPVGSSGVFIDSVDTLYAVDETINFVVWKLMSNAVNATIVAGIVGLSGGDSDQLNFPNDVYVDRNGDIYVSDCFNHRVQKFVNGSKRGVTIAGINGSAGSALNQLNSPRYLAFDSTKTYMYVADFGNHRIMRFLSNATTSTDGVLVAGGSGAGNSNTSLNSPWGIHYLPSISDDLFIANDDGQTVMRWKPGASSGTFLVGSPGVTGSNATLLNYPTGVRIDASLNIYVADFFNHRVQMFCPNNPVGITIAGTGVAGNGTTQLNQPRGIAFDSQMNLYVGDSGNGRVQKFMKL